MSKILVTGGAGFIGSTLADKLINEKHDVVIIDNLISGKIEYINPLATFIKLIFVTLHWLMKFLKKKDLILYFI